MSFGNWYLEARNGDERGCGIYGFLPLSIYLLRVLAVLLRLYLGDDEFALHPGMNSTHEVDDRPQRGCGCDREVEGCS